MLVHFLACEGVYLEIVISIFPEILVFLRSFPHERSIMYHFEPS